MPVSIGAVSTAVTLDLSARLTAPPRGYNSCTGGVPLREVCGRHRSARNAMEADVAAGTVGDQGDRSGDDGGYNTSDSFIDDDSDGDDDGECHPAARQR